jgi:hypothetical protein
MRLSEMKMITGCCVLLLAGLLLSPAISYSDDDFDFEIEIDIAPNVLNIQSEGTAVTVHTDIAYWTVEAYTLTLNGIDIKSWKADNQGNFVAKFWMDEVKALALEAEDMTIGDYNEFVLLGENKAGEVFLGTQEILIIDVVPKGR